MHRSVERLVIAGHRRLENINPLAGLLGSRHDSRHPSLAVLERSVLHSEGVDILLRDMSLVSYTSAGQVVIHVPRELCTVISREHLGLLGESLDEPPQRGATERGPLLRSASADTWRLNTLTRMRKYLCPREGVVDMSARSAWKRAL